MVWDFYSHIALLLCLPSQVKITVLATGFDTDKQMAGKPLTEKKAITGSEETPLGKKEVPKKEIPKKEIPKPSPAQSSSSSSSSVSNDSSFLSSFRKM